MRFTSPSSIRTAALLSPLLLVCALVTQASAQDCTKSSSTNAQARLELTPQGIQNAISWALRQALNISTYDLPKTPLADVTNVPLATSGYTVELTKEAVKSIRFGKPNVSCDNNLTCTFDIPVNQMTYQSDFSLSHDKKTKSWIPISLKVPGVQFSIKTNSAGQSPVVHFRGRISTQGGANDWIQILDDGQSVTLPKGSFALSRDAKEKNPKDHLSNGTFNFAQWLVDDVAAGSKTGVGIVASMVKSAVLPAVVSATRPLLQKGIPVLTDQMNQQVPLFRAQDTIDLNQIDQHATTEQLVAESILKVLKDPKTSSLDQVKSALSDLPSDFGQILEAFRYIRDEPSAAPEFERLMKIWSPVQSTLAQKLKHLGVSDSQAAKTAMPIDHFLSGLMAAQKQVHLNAEREQETFALKAAALSIDQPSRSLDVAMSVCVLCTRDPIPGVPLANFPQFKAKKDYDSALQIPLSAINAVVKQFYDNEAFNICVSSITFQNCAFAPANENKIRLHLKKSPQIKMDHEGLYIDLSGFEKSEVAYGIVNQFQGAKIRVTVGTDPAKSRLMLSLKSPELTFNANATSLTAAAPAYSSWQTQLSASLVKGFDAASQQTLPMIEDEIQAHWGEYVRPISASLASQGVSIRKVEVRGNAITTYQNMNLPDLNPATLTSLQPGGATP